MKLRMFLVASLATLALGTEGAAAQSVYAPVRALVEGTNCESGPIDRCSVPSGKFLSVRGGDTYVNDDKLGAGVPVRVATAGPTGPVAAAEGVTNEYGEWSLRFQPRVNGVVYAAQVLVGATWVNVPDFQVEVTVFAQFVGEQIGFGPRNPVFARGRVNWVDRDGVGRVELRRCTFAAARRCTAPGDFGTLVTSKRVRRSGGGRFVLKSSARRAYGKPLALVYAPGRGSLILGDLQVFRAVPSSYRPR
jgi:hypothetical protein